ESRRIHHDDAAIACPPGNWHDHPVPKGEDASALLSVEPLGVLPAQHFITKGGTEGSYDGVDRSSNEGNLYSPRPAQLGKARVVVHVDVRGLRLWRRCSFWRSHRRIVYDCTSGGPGTRATRGAR